MKKLLLLIVLFLSTTCFSQISKTIIDKTTNRVLCAQNSNYVLADNEYSIPQLETIHYLKSFWNPTTQQFYEGATAQEIADDLKSELPDSVTRKQLKLQLTLSGFNMSTIDTAINSLPEPNKSIALISWNDSSEFDRNNPLLQALASMLGLTDSELDQIFIDASKL